MTVDFGAGPVGGDLDVSWIHGSSDPKQRTDPPVQVHWYDEHTAILRQSKDATYEAPFLFLLFGNDRAVLFDTGATDDGSVRSAVDGAIAEWINKHGISGYELVVAHTHAHGDHVAADPKFRDRPNTVVVGKDLKSVTEFFGFTDWPAESVKFDLGGRIIEIIGAPGHHETAIGVYDPWSGLLLTGDTVYPGRLYVMDSLAFIDTMKRLVAFAEERSVTHVVGCHIEMTRRPRRDYFLGCRYQPGEPPLQMTVGQLREIRDAAVGLDGKPGLHRFDDFIICNGQGKLVIAQLLGRALVKRALRRRK